MSDRTSTHETHDGAEWPSVASSHQRLGWIDEILTCNGAEKIKPGSFFDSDSKALQIAYRILTTAYMDDCESKKARVAALKACIALEEA